LSKGAGTARWQADKPVNQIVQVESLTTPLRARRISFRLAEVNLFGTGEPSATAMILTGPAIKSAVRNRDIAIEPFDETQLNPNSYNYHLADTLLVLGRGGRPVRRVLLRSKGFVLRPGKVYLGATLERIGSTKYVTLLLGRSSVGRLGIFLNVTADLGHLGSCSHWTLELTVVQAVRVYPYMKIGQVSFWVTDIGSSNRRCYDGRYHRDSRPVANRDRSITRRKR
jgi:dCTP deaminase